MSTESEHGTTQQDLKKGEGGESSYISRPTPRTDLIDILATRVVKILTEKVDEPIQQALDRLPADSASARNLPFYDSTLGAIKFQRDSYLAGPAYADRRERQKSRRFPPPRFSPRMPHDATALGHIQLVNVGAWFLPSETVRTALLPVVIALPSGALNEPIVNTVSNAIPLAQPPLDRAVKNAILAVIDDPNMRQVIKNRTQRVLRVNDVTNSEEQY